MEFQKIKKQATTNISTFDWKAFKDEELKRLLKFYRSAGNNMETTDLRQVQIEFETLIDAARICMNLK